MSYTLTKIGELPVYIEYRLVHVSEGNPPPLPAEGYTLATKLDTLYGQDFYVEYREVIGSIVLT